MEAQRVMEGEAPATRVDRWGHPVSIRSDACLAAVHSYYDQALIHGRDRAVILRALLHEPVSVLANALAAYVLSKKNPSKAASLLATAAASLESATHYERTLFGAICCMVGVNRDADAALQRHFEQLLLDPVLVVAQSVGITEGGAMEGEAPTTIIDRWGYPVRTSSAACIAAVNSYYHEFLAYGRDLAVILRALSHDPHCVLANTLAAHFLVSQDLSKASALLAAAASALANATQYEKAVFTAVSSLMNGDQDVAALDQHFELLKEYPRDMVSLKRAQILCFYMGRADLSLKLVEQVLPQNQDQSYIYGMLAFPLLELGRMAEAEGAARKGFDINKLDFWSQHNICHVLQYECRFKEAVDFMKTCSSFWSSCSAFMYTHNWWHVAVCYLEGHAPLQNVLEVYDQYIWKELQRRDAEYGEVYVNALGLLLRFYLRGQGGCVEDRLMAVVNMFKDESSWNVEWLLDILGLWALVNSNEISKADALLKSMKSRVSSMSEEKQHSMQRAILLAEATYEYGKRNYQKVFDILGPDFDAMDYKMIGASDEQIDVFNEIWYDVLLNSGNVSKAIEVIEKQVEKREGVPFLWRLLEKAYFMEGREDAASAAGEKAKALEHAYFG